MFSRRLLTIGLAVVLLSGYFALFGDLPLFYWPLGIALIVTMCTYIFQHQLNWWWYQKYPPELPGEMEAMFRRVRKEFRELSDQRRAEFKTRARLYVESKEFIAQGFDKVAEDVKYIVAYYAVLSSLNKDNFLFQPYDRIVLYLHPFLSPRFPEQVHTYESEGEDGTLILSLEQLTAGFFKPSKYLETGLLVFTELLANEVPAFPQDKHDQGWKALDALGIFTRSRIEELTGIPQASPVPMLLYTGITRRDDLAGADPEIVRIVAGWLGEGSSDPAVRQ